MIFYIKGEQFDRVTQLLDTVYAKLQPYMKQSLSVWKTTRVYRDLFVLWSYGFMDNTCRFFAELVDDTFYVHHTDYQQHTHFVGFVEGEGFTFYSMADIADMCVRYDVITYDAKRDDTRYMEHLLQLIMVAPYGLSETTYALAYDPSIRVAQYVYSDKDVYRDMQEVHSIFWHDNATHVSFLGEPPIDFLLQNSVRHYREPLCCIASGYVPYVYPDVFPHMQHMYSEINLNFTLQKWEIEMYHEYYTWVDLRLMMVQFVNVGMAVHKGVVMRSMPLLLDMYDGLTKSRTLGYIADSQLVSYDTSVIEYKDAYSV